MGLFGRSVRAGVPWSVASKMRKCTADHLRLAWPVGQPIGYRAMADLAIPRAADEPEHAPNDKDTCPASLPERIGTVKLISPVVQLGSHEESEIDPIRVLIADDDATVRDEIASYLTAEGLSIVDVVADGARAFLQALWLRPDVMLLDLHMPGLDGIEVTHLILKEAPGTQVIILTAFPDQKNRRDAELAGAARLIGKEEGLSAVVATVRAVATPSPERGR
jgi:CheY-like chemotaxis protein